MQLNTEQQAAVNHLNGPLLVLAGAGSGKTRVITSRIAKLIEGGVSPKQIVAVTFTNKAAAEMRERIQKAVHFAPLICTFHALGVRILRESIESLGYKRNFTIYDEDDALKLLRTCLKEIGIENKKITPKAIKQLISKAKNQLQEPQVDDTSSEIEQAAPQIFKLYQSKLFEASAVDFDDLLYLPVKLFEEFPKVLEIYQDRFEHLLIDEYQDTNKAQYALALQLAQKNKNLFVVGDPDQSIYTWRGANIENILNFEKDWPGAKVIKLEQNYRSTSNILEAANALVSCNESRFKKNLWSDLGEGEKIYQYNAYNDREESSFIVQKIEDFTVFGDASLKDMVIFYRTNAQSRPFEDELLKRNMPYVILGGISFYQRREIKDLLAFLRLVENPSDTVSFQRTINLPKRGFGDASIIKIVNIAKANHWTIVEACEKILFDSSLIKLNLRQKEGLQEYVKLLTALKKESAESAIQELVYQVVQQSKYLDVIKLEPDTYDDRKANIDELIAKDSDWEEEAEEASLAKFLEELTLSSQQDKMDDSDRLTLMSFHNGKGLEFDTVFMAGMEETLFPHINCLNTAQGVEEERRLCYVGMTRAKKALYLTCATNRFIWGGVRTMRPSRFLKEIPPNYFQPSKASLAYSHKPKYSSQEAPSSSFSKGELVLHNDFGIGKVINIKESSLGITYDVTFQNDGNTKTLLAKYAKLSPIS